MIAGYFRPLFVLLGCVALAFGMDLDAADETTKRPNFVFLLADDLGYGDLPSYGHPYAQTPSIDRLAAEGTSFRQFYDSGATCSPSRTGFMTGRFPERFEKYPGHFGLGNTITVTQLLREQGYRTGHVGKWHLGPDKLPGTYGIEFIKGGKDRNTERGRDARVADHAIEFIQEHRSEPFYLNVWFHATHYPVDPPESYSAKFNDLTVVFEDFPNPLMRAYLQEYRELGGDTDRGMQKYAGDILQLDTQVGRILDAIKQAGIGENTLVVFTSDNGPANYEPKKHRAKDSSDSNMLGSAGILRGRKASFYEGGIRTPFIIRWPGHVAEGRVDAQSVIGGVDWLPTILSMAGIETPSSLALDGEDVSDIWFGVSRDRNKDLVWTIGGGQSEAVIRAGQWKLIKRGRSESELYRLDQDPAESHDLASKYPEIREDLEARITGLLKSFPEKILKKKKEK